MGTAAGPSLISQTDLAYSTLEQAALCERLGSPFYCSLLSHIAADISSSGICWRLLEARASDPPRFKLPLRFLAAIHLLVLEGRVSELAHHYASLNADAAWNVLVSVLAEYGDEILARIPDTLQTSEVKRCCALLPGFLEVARTTRLPLRVLEIGSSAGLNLRWDRYRYESSIGSWGPPDSPLIFDDAFTGHRPPLDTSVEIVERRGCDLNPIDPLSVEGSLRLRSFLWPDLPRTFARINKATEVARRTAAIVDRADAIDWLDAQLAKPMQHVATVLFQSIVLLYFSPAQRDRFTDIVTAAAERATPEAPLAWLSMEPNGREDEIILTLWPRGARKLIATAGYHGGRALLLNSVWTD